MLHMYLITLALSTCISDIVVIEYIRVPYIIDSDNQISKKIWECRSAVFLSRAVWLIRNSDEPQPMSIFLSGVVRRKDALATYSTFLPSLSAIHTPP